MDRLVWVPVGTLAILGDHEGLEMVEIPADPEHHPRLGEVAGLVAPPRTPTFDVTMQFGHLWERMPSLRLLQVLTAGVDWIAGTAPERVTLCSARGAHSVPVSEWVMAAVLAGLKDLGRFRDDQRAGRWAGEPVGELADAGVLILGHGAAGREVEKRLAPFAPRIWRVARREREGVVTTAALPDILPLADIVIVLLALTPQTERIVDAQFISRMRPQALLVNASRGRLVDTSALLEALDARRIRAVLDVTDPEPLPTDHPLWRAPNVLITPHIAAATPGSRERVYDLVRLQLEHFARNEPLLNVVAEGY